MSNFQRLFCGIFILFLSMNIVYSQEHSNNTQEVKYKHRIAGLYGLVHVPEGHEEGSSDNTGILIASYGLEYSYRLNHKWGLGLMVNIESGNYLIHEDIHRDNAILISGVGIYELMLNWEVYFGAGVEIEKHHNYALFRLGTLYKFPIGKEWDISPSFTFNHKIVYNSWEIAITVGKEF